MNTLKYRTNNIDLSQIPSFRYLAAFERAAFHGSFTKAAEDLGRSSSAISRAINELEVRFGCTLFERLGKTVKLTNIGKEYLVKVREALKILEQGGASIVDKSNENVIRLHTQPLIAKDLIIPRLSDFKKRYPDYSLLIEISRESVDWPVSDIDIELRYGYVEGTKLHIDKVGRIGFVPACAPILLNKNDGLKDIPDLERFTVLVDERRPDSWNKWLEAVGYPELELKQQHWLSDFMAIMGMVLNGDAVSLVPYPFVTEYPCYGNGLIAPFSSENIDFLDYYLVCRRDQEYEKKINTCKNWLYEIFGEVDLKYAS